MTTIRQPQRVTTEEFRKMFEKIPQPQPTMRHVAKGFGEMLQKVRGSRRYTLRELEQLSGVPNPVISAIENGRRRCGATVADKLASALFDEGDEESRRSFLYAAAATIKARGVIEDAQLYPPAILDAVAAKLRAMGIRDREILAVHSIPSQRPAGDNDLLIVLHRGRRLRVEIAISDAKKDDQ